MSLYKYLHSDRIDVLDNLMIRFTQPSVLNDPFEALPIIEKLLENEDFFNLINEVYDKKELQLAIEEAVISEYKKYFNNLEKDTIIITYLIQYFNDNFMDIASELIDEVISARNSFKGYARQLKHSFSENFGILSLSQNPDNLLMWSHYAESHKGFVIQFDEKALFFDQRINQNDVIRKLKKVIYVKARPRIERLLRHDKVKDDSYMNELMEYFFLVKSDLWCYEEEKRMILPLNNASKVINISNTEKGYLFNIPYEVIRSVIVGNQMESVKINKIKDILSGNKLTHVKLFRSELDLNNFKVNIVPMTR